MSIPLKTEAQINFLAQNGALLSQVLLGVLKFASPGVRLSALEERACQLIKKTGAKPSFKMVPNYRFATCLNLNEGVVHGLPDRQILKKGDLLSVDLGLFKNGLHTDMAWTIVIGEPTSFQKKFLLAGQKALFDSFQAALAGNQVNDLSANIENALKRAHFYPVEGLTGHGLGQSLHEPPPIPCQKSFSATPSLRPGMVLALEAIYTQSRTGLKTLADGWTIATADQSLGGLFECDLAVTHEKPLLLTPLSGFSAFSPFLAEWRKV